MTKEEAIEFGNMWLEMNEDCKDSSTYAFFHMAIKVLEQEPILNKIRAEINKYKSTIDKAISEDELKIKGMKEAYTDCIEIIDKYKATPSRSRGSRRMTLDEAIKTEKNTAEANQRVIDTGIVFNDVSIDMLYCDDTEVIEKQLVNYQRCAEEHRQLAEWLEELKQLRKQRTGEWQRMSDLPEDEDDRYQCSRCGNVVHYLSKENLYTFNRWCGRCGSNNDRR